MKTIINEEIKRIQELMGFQKPLINEQWRSVIDDLLKGTAKTDNFYTNIARFGGKTANELEAALKRNEDILTALGKSENEFATFLRNNETIFNIFADEFVTTTRAIELEKDYMEGLSKLTTKEGIELRLREMIALSKRYNELGELAVLQKMYKNLDNISTKLTTSTIGKIYKSVDDFIADSLVSTKFKSSPKATKEAYQKFCKTYWDRIKNLKSEKEVTDFMRDEAGILTTPAEKTRFDKFKDNLFKGSPQSVPFKVAGAVGGGAAVIVASITAIWSLCSWLACITNNRTKQKNPTMYCSTQYLWGTAESMVNASDATEEEGGTGQSSSYTNDLPGFQKWCNDKNIARCDYDSEIQSYVDNNLNEYVFDNDKNVWKPKEY